MFAVPSWLTFIIRRRARYGVYGDDVLLHHGMLNRKSFLKREIEKNGTSCSVEGQSGRVRRK